YWRYNRELDRAEELKVYSDRRVTNYYKNEFGRSAGNSPFDGRMFWSWLRSPDGSHPHTNQWAKDWQEAPLRPYFGEDLVVEGRCMHFLCLMNAAPVSIEKVGY